VLFGEPETLDCWEQSFVNQVAFLSCHGCRREAPTIANLQAADVDVYVAAAARLR